MLRRFLANCKIIKNGTQSDEKGTDAKYDLVLTTVTVQQTHYVLIKTFLILEQKDRKLKRIYAKFTKIHPNQTML